MFAFEPRIVCFSDGRATHSESELVSSSMEWVFPWLKYGSYLRWCSKAFMLYLRNLACLSHDHIAAFDKAAAMPHFY
jgi:hypothetical protein